uniref:AlNc14C480G11885 protein n=1 Tax=Albugo laibachii Nc14 TaxID=890382 RepID=F0X0E5_9STRA|nr:AlNc14C480G11885 [Albugo laibachii Nc14]|eukprot:CCA27231.1 AlNc14C480G11885 [Albugo laibachii Nc14]
MARTLTHGIRIDFDQRSLSLSPEHDSRVRVANESFKDWLRLRLSTGHRSILIHLSTVHSSTVVTMTKRPMPPAQHDCLRPAMKGMYYPIAQGIPSSTGFLLQGALFFVAEKSLATYSRSTSKKRPGRAWENRRFELLEQVVCCLGGSNVLPYSEV